MHNSSDKLSKLDYISWLSFASFATTAIIIGLCLPEISNELNLNHFFASVTESLRNLALLCGLVFIVVSVSIFGKKYLITWGHYLLAIGLIGASFSSSSVFLWLGFLLVGLGGGFIEATINPLVVDLHPKNTAKYMNLSNAFYPLGIVVAALIFAELLKQGLSWRSIFRIAAVFSVFVGILFQTSLFPQNQEQEKFYPRSLIAILKQPFFWLLAFALFLATGIESAFMFWSRTYIDSFLSQDIRLASFSVVIFAAMMALGRFSTTKLTEKLTIYQLMFIACLMGGSVCVFMPFMSQLWGFYILLALAGFAVASFWPIIMAHSVTLIEGNTTSLISMLILFGISGYGLFPVIIGSLSQAYHLKIGFAILPVSFFLLLLLIVVIYQKDRKNQ